jgi:hypothetical protein
MRDASKPALMDMESHRRLNREYLWFAAMLVAVLIGFTTQENAGSGSGNQSQAALAVSSERR